MFNENYITEKYKISKYDLSDESWNLFIQKSHNKNIFTHLEFITNIKYVNFFQIKKKKELVAVFFLKCHNKEVKNIKELIYTPIIFRDVKNKNQSSFLTEKNEIIGAFAYFIKNNFVKANLTFDYQLDDFRPFSWINYESNKVLFKINDIRYTQIIKIYEELNLTNLKKTFFYKNLSRRTRQNFNYAQNQNYIFDINFSKKIFKELTICVFQDQGIEINFDIDLRSNILERLYKQGFIKMFIIYDKKKPVSFSIFGIVADKAIYLHGGSIKSIINSKDNYQICNLINSLIYLKNLNIHIFDLEGINSPSRSFFKIGLGGAIYPYYNILFQKKL